MRHHVVESPKARDSDNRDGVEVGSITPADPCFELINYFSIENSKSNKEILKSHHDHDHTAPRFYYEFLKHYLSKRSQ